MDIIYSKVINEIGEYPFSEIYKKVAELKEKGIKVIDFGVGDPKSPTPDFIIDNLSKFARNRATSGYPSYIGNISYRKACANYMKREYGVDLNPETEISSTIGSKEAIFNFPTGFINSGDIVICPTPGYPVYKTGTKFRNGKVHFTPLLEKNDFLIDFALIPDNIAHKAKIIWTNYPNSPTGASAPREWLQVLVSWAKYFNVIIAADEGCYNDIYFGEKPTSILEIQKTGVIAFYSLSKRSNMTGYRVGFVAGDERIISGFKKVKTNIDSGTPTFIQDVATLALNDQVEVLKMREEYKKKRDIMIEALTSCGLETPKGDSTFYVWQKTPKGQNSIKFSNTLIELGIIVTPGQLISDEADGINPGQNFVRFALVPTMEEIIEAATRIKENLKI
ncbi:aminotransferase class I/II-fold pyridoxal phosphate-dependent enzyme [Candidatus Bandiella numerosa]|jgi:LL-diaminopimelate aminotransferase|uniref:aminotransferase class I/II-fold pyridoxal phosphate-dependent enzyme n=1 Tax=Candidatus Bandiella numerosa TaxID=2570586 RepID=UPI00249F7350|nr:aminotransferase class I/II-fold pyridoxal phosphate-dependent enzyme [Candidatus Bandiella numerosa]WHA05250.1 aminotransferase class I/II-fold pyridoxal phosphate-dependent enzyme [Candidatus Bandiella numerosa]